MPRKPWWSQGIKFECQGSGKCCTSRGSYGWVYLTLEDRRRFAKHFRMSTRQFTQLYTKRTDGLIHLINGPDSINCVFLDGKKCSAYEGRPTQCRTWPFWPEVMKPKAWSKEVKAFCPGVGKGKLIPAEEIKKQIDRQIHSESEL